MLVVLGTSFLADRILGYGCGLSMCLSEENYLHVTIHFLEFLWNKKYGYFLAKRLKFLNFRRTNIYWDFWIFFVSFFCWLYLSVTVQLFYKYLVTFHISFRSRMFQSRRKFCHQKSNCSLGKSENRYWRVINQNEAFSVTWQQLITTEQAMFESTLRKYE